MSVDKMAAWIFALSTCVGCSSSYPGSFEVRNCYPETIVIKEWEGRGSILLPRGYIPKGGCGDEDMSKSVVNGRQGSLPEKVTVTWQVDDESQKKQEPETFRQEIHLIDVVPKDGKGITVFTLDEQGRWAVTFRPEL